MKIFDLSGHPNLPCFILKHGGVTVMLDCSLDFTSTLCYLPMNITPDYVEKNGFQPAKDVHEIEGQFFMDAEPEFIIPELDMSKVDAILISNYNFALALPYITEYTEFRGVIYATEPTMNFARLLMEELLSNIRKSLKSDKPHSSSSSALSSLKTASLKNPEIFGLFQGRLGECRSSKDWRRLYNSYDIQSCISKFQVVGFSEFKEIPGGLQIQAFSSGYCIGSCNWLISSSYHKFGYISGSTFLTTHPKPIDHDSLKSCDVLILNCLSQQPQINPDASIRDFCTSAASTLKNGGNVLVPCSTVGLLYDLVECLHKHLESTGQAHTPMYCLSPVATSSLAYSNIYAEWLSPAKQSKVYQPDSPFPHTELLRCKKLEAYPSIYEGFSKEVRHPCVVFTGHSSLRFGDVVHLMQSWNTSPLNCVIITDPGFNYHDVLAPYAPLVMTVCYYPIDTGMSYFEANKFIKELNPKHLVVPEKYLSGTKPGTFIEPDLSPIPTSRLEVIKLTMKREFQKAAMTPELANSLSPSEIQPNVAVALVTGALSGKDSKFTIEPIALLNKNRVETGSSTQQQSGTVLKSKLAYGMLNVQEFVRRLKMRNLVVKTEDFGDGNFIVELPNNDTLVQVDGSSSHIICNDENVRVVLRDVLLECLSQLT